MSYDSNEVNSEIMLEQLKNKKKTLLNKLKSAETHSVEDVREMSESVARILGLSRGSSISLEPKAVYRDNKLQPGSKEGPFLQDTTVFDFERNKSKVEYVGISFDELTSLYGNNFSFITLLELNRSSNEEIIGNNLIRQFFEFLQNQDSEKFSLDGIRDDLLKHPEDILIIDSGVIEGNQAAVYEIFKKNDAESYPVIKAYLFDGTEMIDLTEVPIPTEENAIGREPTSVRSGTKKRLFKAPSGKYYLFNLEGFSGGMQGVYSTNDESLSRTTQWRIISQDQTLMTIKPKSK